MTSRMALAFAFLIALTGCPKPRGERYVAPAEEVRAPGEKAEQPSDARLRELVTLAELVVVGRVVERRNAPEGENYRVEVLEILSHRGAETVAVGDSIRASTFLFRTGKSMAKIGRLKQPNRYVFFLSPMERDGWWLHLDDASIYLLPDAGDTLRELRAMRTPPPKQNP